MLEKYSESQPASVQEQCTRPILWVVMTHLTHPSSSQYAAKGTIVLVVEYFAGYQIHLIEPLSQLLGEAGYGLVIASCNAITNEGVQSGNRQDSNVVLDLIQNAEVDGIIFNAATVCLTLNEAELDQLVSEIGRTPAVYLGRKVGGQDSVMLNNKQGMSDCMEFIASAPENQTFMFIGGSKTNSDSMEREEIFRQAIESHGKTLDEELIVHCDFITSKAYHSVIELIPTRPDVDVIVCANDDSAIGAIHALEELKLSVPEDIRVSGFDDYLDATYCRPVISSVSQPFAEMASHASRLVLEKIAGENQRLGDELVQTNFRPRESTFCQSQKAVRQSAIPLSEQAKHVEQIAESLVSSIYLPKTNKSVSEDLLKSVIRDAAMGNIETMVECIDRFVKPFEMKSDEIVCWQNLVTEIENRAKRLPNSQYTDQLQSLMEQPLLRIKDAIQAWRTRQEYRNKRTQQINNQFLEEVNKLTAIDELIEPMTRWLKHLEVARCFFVVYSDFTNAVDPRASLLIDHVMNREAVGLIDEPFSTSGILPDELQCHLRCDKLVMYPIHSGGIQFGYMLIDPGPQMNVPFDAIVTNIGSSMRHMLQLDNFQRHANTLELVNKKLSSLANYDELTGLPNRAFFQHTLSQLLADAQKNGSELALMFIDLDGFKLINDSLGHSAGDQLLRIVAKRLQSVLDAGAFISRLGGDEFTIVLKSQDFLIERVNTVCQEILDALSSSYELTQLKVNVSGSVGVALFPAHAADAETLTRKADSAMYHAKDSGKNCFRIFTPELDVEFTWRLEQDQNMRQGFLNDEFHLLYQPKYKLSNLNLVGAEALLRWQPEGSADGPIAPDQFVSIAEQTGFITQLDHFVLRSACEAIRRWREQGLALPIAVNVSAIQLHKPEFVEFVASCIAEHEIDPQLLELELTESAAMADVDLSIMQLTRLQKLGITIAIDDFGTGYSSLNYLKRLPVNALKIDREFLMEIRSDHDDGSPDLAIAKAIIALGRSMNFKVIAEGIEHQYQKDVLLELGCHEGQGFYFSKPVDEVQLSHLMTGRVLGKAA